MIKRESLIIVDCSLLLLGLIAGSFLISCSFSNSCSKVEVFLAFLRVAHIEHLHYEVRETELLLSVAPFDRRVLIGLLIGRIGKDLIVDSVFYHSVT
jgi:hypothetical protein